MFHKTILYLFPTEIEENDGVAAYNKIMEQAGESNVNERISVLEGLIRTLISVLPTEGNVNVAVKTTTPEEPVEDLTAPTTLPNNELRFVSR